MSDTEIAKNLAIMLRRIIWQINKLDGDSSLKVLAGKADVLLRQYGLQGSPLRDDPDPILQLPPLTDAMYHAVRGLEFEFSEGGPQSVMGYMNDDILDEMWDAINTALRTSRTIEGAKK